jgi:hypothetical protein
LPLCTMRYLRISPYLLFVSGVGGFLLRHP